MIDGIEMFGTTRHFAGQSVMRQLGLHNAAHFPDVFLALLETLRHAVRERGVHIRLEGLETEVFEF